MSHYIRLRIILPVYLGFPHVFHFFHLFLCVLDSFFARRNLFSEYFTLGHLHIDGTPLLVDLGCPGSQLFLMLFNLCPEAVRFAFEFRIDSLEFLFFAL